MKLKFIRVTDLQGFSIIINLDDVSHVCAHLYQGLTQSTIVLKCGITLFCLESPDQVFSEMRSAPTLT